MQECARARSIIAVERVVDAVVVAVHCSNGGSDIVVVVVKK